MDSKNYDKIFDDFKKNYHDIYGNNSKNIKSINKGNLEILVLIKPFTNLKKFITKYKKIDIKYSINDTKIFPIDYSQEKEEKRKKLIRHILENEKSW